MNETEMQHNADRHQRDLLELLACAALSLYSYENSCGGGGGEKDARHIAEMLGFDGDYDDVWDWLRKRAGGA